LGRSFFGARGPRDLKTFKNETAQQKKDDSTRLDKSDLRPSWMKHSY
jgi:hypothetical protein